MNSTYSYSQVGVRPWTDCRLPYQIQIFRILIEYTSKSYFRMPQNQINEIWTFWSRSIAITRNLLLFVIAKWEEIGPTPPGRLCSRLLLGGHCYLDVLTGLHSPALSCHSPDCVALTKQMCLSSSFFFPKQCFQAFLGLPRLTNLSFLLNAQLWTAVHFHVNWSLY